MTATNNRNDGKKMMMENRLYFSFSVILLVPRVACGSSVMLLNLISLISIKIIFHFVVQVTFPLEHDIRCAFPCRCKVREREREPSRVVKVDRLADVPKIQIPNIILTLVWLQVRRICSSTILISSRMAGVLCAHLSSFVFFCHSLCLISNADASTKIFGTQMPTLCDCCCRSRGNDFTSLTKYLEKQRTTPKKRNLISFSKWMLA